MSRRRVVVTGMGCVSALGPDVETFWGRARAGESAIGPLRNLDMGEVRFQNGAEIAGFVPAEHFEEKQLIPLDRFAQLAVVAARQAVRQAAPGWSETERQQTAVVTGSCYGGKTSEDEGFREIYGSGGRRPRIHPMTIPRLMANAGSSWIAMEYGLQGPAYTVSTACSSANHAIGQAFWLVRNGICDVALTGGCEAPFTPGSMKAWEALRVVSGDTCRPFSKDRKGMVLGEGAAMLVLEAEERAKARGAEILGEIVGFGMSADAHHVTQPSVEGPALAIERALADGGVDGGAVGHINAHGTGTPANDPVETAAIRRVLGGQADRVRVTSTKSLHGHTLGAAGALEAVAAVLTLARGEAPPTANYLGPDPECDLPLILAPEACDAEYALSHSFAFGGLNAVLLFRAYRG
ncbi:MAG: beta-ketoacyl-[acyl-carrier-protein] synthase family protein [Acidobacteriota bacterium]